MALGIAQAVARMGGRTFYTGGFVRDCFRKAENKDIDIEVHEITPSVLENILDSLGKRISVGESFGIYNLKGYLLDIAMPRTEEYRGNGHRDFDISVDPFIGTFKAAKRRDFTINAMMKDVLTGEVIDFFGGKKDIEARIIRHVDGTSFSEDPLRVLRAAQFASRLRYTVAPETVELCKSIDITKLSCERVTAELEKALLKSDTPSVFFETLRDMGQLGFWFKELYALTDVPQNPEHHAEGDVWTHTMMVTDAAVRFSDRVNNGFAFMLSALTHDFGKAVSTKVGEDGKIHSHNHETEGLPLVRAFIKRLTSERELIKYVLNMSELHMRPNVLAADNSSVKATNALFDKSVDPEALIYLAVSDGLGKISAHGYTSCESFMKERLEIYNEYMSRPYLTGSDLIDAGLEPSENFSEYLGFAHKLRLSGVSRENALKQVLSLAKRKQ